MRLSRQALRLHPFQIAPHGVAVLQNAIPHVAHDPNDRVTLTIQKNPNGVYNVTFTADPNGNTIFLPYRPDEVHSVRLPANPGPGGPTNFVTANLDGCCMFVDRKTNGDVIVYHANASAGVTPTVQQSATQPTFQTPACLNQLTNLYNTASLYYNGTANTHHHGFAKARYLRDVNAILVRKSARGRTGGQYGGGAEHSSLTTFAGFFRNNRWEFWFQTYSQFIYDRPNNHWKSKFGFQSINPHVTQDPYEIVEAGMIFRVG